MRTFWIGVLSLAMAGFTCRADDSPFELLPLGWQCATTGDIHYWSGRCRDAVTETTLEFHVGGRDDFGELCRSEPYLEQTQGKLGSLDYCESFAPSAASYAASFLLREAPDFIADYDEWPLPEESSYTVAFWRLDTVWVFTAVVRNDCERDRVRELLLSEGRLAIH